MSRRTLLLSVLAAAALLLAAAAARRLLREPPSDEELVSALLDDAARAAGEKRVNGVVEAVSERFRGEGLDRDGVKRLVALHVLRGSWVSVSIAGRTVAVRGDAADATVDVVLASGGQGKALAELLPGEASAYRIACRLEREPDGWRVVAATWRPLGLAEAIAGPQAR